MPLTSITPTCKVLLSYDIRPEAMDSYYQYVLKEFVPELETMGLYMFRVWHVAYGAYPVRQLEFVAEDIEDVHDILLSDRWNALENQLKSYTLRYGRKLVRFRAGFQF